MRHDHTIGEVGRISQLNMRILQFERSWDLVSECGDASLDFQLRE